MATLSTKCRGRTRHWFTLPSKLAGGTGVRSPICIYCGAPNPRSLSDEETEIVAEIAPKLLPGDHPKHEHRWRMMFHLDGCHSYNSTYSCHSPECGAVMYAYDERDFKEDPYAMIWSEGSDCARCKELQAGAEPKSTREVIEGGEPGSSVLP